MFSRLAVRASTSSSRVCARSVTSRAVAPSKKNWRWIALSGGAAFSAALLLAPVQDKFLHLARAEAEPSAQEKSVVPAQATVNPGFEIKIYQFDICPFCNKVKAFLDYLDIPYSTVEVNPMGKSQLRWSSYRKVPVAIINGDAIGDSDAIIAAVWNMLKEKEQQGTLAENIKQRMVLLRYDQPEVREALEWMGKKFFIRVYPNLTNTLDDAWQACEFYLQEETLSPGARYALRVFGPLGMWAGSARSQKKYGIKDPRAELLEEAKVWTSQLGNQPFHGGVAPDYADVALFGGLRGIEGLNASHDIMTMTNLQPWYERMKAAVGPSKRVAKLSA